MSKLRGNVAIAGIGEVPTGRFPEKGAISFALESARMAIEDAGPSSLEELTRQTMTDSRELWRKATGGRSFSKLETTNSPVAFVSSDEMDRKRDRL